MRRSRAHGAVRGGVRRARYTPERRGSRAVVETDTTASFESTYKRGYDAGLAAARKQLERENGAAQLTERKAQTAVGTEGSLATYEPGATRLQGVEDGAGRTETKNMLRQPALGDRTDAKAPETETLETPPLDEIATLHMNGAAMPAPLRGSLASLERQNDRLDADGLERILDEADLASRIEHKLLVPVPASANLMVNPNLAENHRYCRPWTAQFLADLARAHEAEFHKPIEVNSAVRTVEYQKRLMRTNGNAADAEGDIVSPHLTGATVDIAKQGLSGKEMAWMRRLLAGLEKAGKIDVEEEFEQACFHITVYKSYTAAR